MFDGEGAEPSHSNPELFGPPMSPLVLHATLYVELACLAWMVSGKSRGIISAGAATTWVSVYTIWNVGPPMLPPVLD